MARAIVIMLLVLASTPGCSSCRRMLDGMGPPQVELADPGSTLVVGIEGEWWSEEPVRIHPLGIAEENLEIGEVLTVDRPASGRIPATSVHGEVLYLARGTDLERRRPLAPKAAVDTRKLVQEPASLLGTERGCFAGLEGRVDFVDFSGAKPGVRKLHEDPGLRKPVDFLVPMDGGLVAVDDEVVPKYAFVLHLHPDRPAVHRFTAELPSGPNEAYTDAAAFEDTLVITATFGVMTGPGNTLYRWPIRRSSGRESGDQLEEFKPEHRPGLAPTLLAGGAYSPWNGLGIVGDHIFIGAGARGIQHGPARGTPGTLHDVGGWCLDLLELAGRLVVLVADGEPEPGTSRVTGKRRILVLEWDGKAEALVEKARHDIEPPLDSLAR